MEFDPQSPDGAPNVSCMANQASCKCVTADSLVKLVWFCTVIGEAPPPQTLRPLHPPDRRHEDAVAGWMVGGCGDVSGGTSRTGCEDVNELGLLRQRCVHV